ncbi:hypothetical protein DFH06DRAFT_1472302 [Mycena polygramma]|nr:hypothetical protein DFH06DRAFT_1472302 [Mycena polygramma]
MPFASPALLAVLMAAAGVGSTRQRRPGQQEQHPLSDRAHRRHHSDLNSVPDLRMLREGPAGSTGPIYKYAHSSRGDLDPRDIERGEQRITSGCTKIYWHAGERVPGSYTTGLCSTALCEG